MSEDEIGQDTLTDQEEKKWRDLMNKDPDQLADAEKTSKIKLSVKRRFSPPEWSLTFELASPDGRRADAIAVNTFPSRNFKIIGFEFKSSRSDWLSEKNESAKSDYFVTLCDEWYIVAWAGVVNEEELPEGWGLLELKPNSEQLWKQVESELTDYQEGEPDRGFWGRFIKKAVGGDSNYTRHDIQEAKKRGYEKAEAEISDQRLDREAEKLREKAETVDKLQEAGLFGYLHPVDDEEIERINKARELIEQVESDRYRALEGTIESFERQACDDLEELENMAESLQQSLAEIREAKHELVSDLED